MVPEASIASAWGESSCAGPEPWVPIRRVVVAVARSKTTIVLRRLSSTKPLPPASKATATGLGRTVGPGFGEPQTVAIVPSGLISWTRPLTESVTARMPVLSAATPSGPSN